MFTGIVECLGKIVAIEREAGNIHFSIQSPISSELKIDQSVSHNGVCLTVVKVEGDVHVVTAIQETLNKTDLAFWKVGDSLNLERCLKVDARFDGHIVQGHVDCIAKYTKQS
ncbi:MAG: riboflavin synthase [Bacteroidia bacterium]